MTNLRIKDLSRKIRNHALNSMTCRTQTHWRYRHPPHLPLTIDISINGRGQKKFEDKIKIKFEISITRGTG